MRESFGIFAHVVVPCETNFKTYKLMKPDNKEMYLEPETLVLEVNSESIICQSNPGEVPGNLGGGGWI